MTRQRSLTRGEQNAALLIIDVRGPDEFTGPLGHIAGATNLPLNELPDRTPDLVRDDRPMVLVYNTDRRSSIAARRLLEAGVSEVSVLRGGMEQWRGARLAGFVTTPPRIGAIIAFFRSVHVLNRCHIRELADCIEIRRHTASSASSPLAASSSARLTLSATASLSQRFSIRLATRQMSISGIMPGRLPAEPLSAVQAQGGQGNEIPSFATGDRPPKGSSRHGIWTQPGRPDRPHWSSRAGSPSPTRRPHTTGRSQSSSRAQPMSRATPGCITCPRRPIVPCHSRKL